MDALELTEPGLPMAAHCWCEIDTLLTSKTITVALQNTKARAKRG